MVLVALVTRDLCLAHTQTIGQFALAQAIGDPGGDKELANAGQSLNGVKIMVAHPIIPLELFPGLGADRVRRDRQTTSEAGPCGSPHPIAAAPYPMSSSDADRARSNCVPSDPTSHTSGHRRNSRRVVRMVLGVHERTVDKGEG